MMTEALIEINYESVIIGLIVIAIVVSIILLLVKGYRKRYR